jgi:hypothetical protein
MKRLQAKVDAAEVVCTNEWHVVANLHGAHASMHSIHPCLTLASAFGPHALALAGAAMGWVSAPLLL